VFDFGYFTSYQLVVTNDGRIDSACSNLVQGELICLGNKGEDCSDTYVVRENDTCDRIITVHRLNSTLLYLNNPQINEACDNIYIGEVSRLFRHQLLDQYGTYLADVDPNNQVLCVGQSVQVPPAPTGPPPAATIPATATPAVPSTTNTSTKVSANTPTKAPVNRPLATTHTSAAILTPGTTHTSAAILTSETIHSSATTHTSAAISTGITHSGDSADDDEDLPFCDEI